MPEATNPGNQLLTQSRANRSPLLSPDYVGIVRFLIEPFLESPESLRVDCEINPGQAKAWIRLAFEEPEKGRVYGRGGRNIQAIRTVLSAVAQTAGHSVYLDIYEDRSNSHNDDSFSSRSSGDRRMQGRSSADRYPRTRRRSRSVSPQFRSGRNGDAIR